jgi:hypothetical protein
MNNELKTNAHLLQTTVIRSADLKTRIIKKDNRFLPTVF